jgi:hypothetical protein
VGGNLEVERAAGEDPHNGVDRLKPFMDGRLEE